MARSLLALGLIAACGCAGKPSNLPALEDLNVLFIVVDTLGAEHVGAIAGLDHTPRIDRLAAEGVLCTRAFSPAPWTQPAVASMMTGVMPSRHGLHKIGDMLRTEKPTLVERMRALGFATAGVVSHTLVKRQFGFARGFDHYDESPIGGHDAIVAGKVSDAALAWLETHHRERFFLFLHYFDPHYAYQHHPAFDRTSDYRGPLKPGMDIWELLGIREQLTSADIDYLVGLYREEIAYTDAQIGRVLDALERLAVADDTLVILTSDHGEEFMRHGWIGHTRTLYNELLHVPLIFRMKGLAPRSVDVPVSLVDLMPSLLALSNTASPGAETDGLVLWPWLTGEATEPPDRRLFAEVSFVPYIKEKRRFEKMAFKTAVIHRGSKLIHDLLDEDWSYFDFEADPEELEDLSGRGLPAEADLRSVLTDWESRRTNEDPAAAPLQLSDEEVERLRSLGYLR